MEQPADLMPELVGLAKRVLRMHVQSLLREHGKKRAVNFARQMARHGFADAGVSLGDECSVHDDHGTIHLTAEY